MKCENCGMTSEFQDKEEAAMNGKLYEDIEGNYICEDCYNNPECDELYEED